ncbi:MAG: tRNA lysidine(34) synthetase TilS [Gloeobacteraceae cyanobacterium ES-bin-144]|nr:tRNA lysidine(34) synthetase TilS [Verrucomicrobiales bacterium]
MALEDDIPWLASASRRARWLVGVSGGGDSVALLHVLVANGFRNVVVCHLNHGLRGRESAGDARFVQSLAKRLGLDCEVGKNRVDLRMKERGESMETAARSARHDFFAECAAKHRCRRILLAHNADDQAETVLWNLLRGSHGMKGMRQENAIRTAAGQELLVVRPLLGIRHGALLDWLRGNGHRWREDASNQEPVAIRNRLRNEVFPLMDKISGRDAVAAFVRAATDATEREVVEELALAEAKVIDPQGRLHLPALGKLALPLQRLAVKNFLITHGVSSVDRQLLERAVDLMDTKNPAVINLPGGRRLRRREGRLWIDG